MSCGLGAPFLDKRNAKAAKCLSQFRVRASDLKVESTFRSDASFVDWRIVRGGKPDPLFTGVALRVADAALWIRTMRYYDDAP